MLRRLTRLFRRRSQSNSEADVAQDRHQATNRSTGGVPGYDHGDELSTTGTGSNDMFVGRVAGDDLGYAGETGAEQRAKAADDPRNQPPRTG